MSKPVSIKDLEDGKLINKSVHVFGWVKTFRSNRFISLNDGSMINDIQCVIDLQSSDVDWLVPHQANLRIIDATRERAGLPEEKVMINIQNYGNTTAGTLQLCLWDWEKKLKKGDNLLLAAFGGGFTWGSVYLKWAYNA